MERRSSEEPPHQIIMLAAEGNFVLSFHPRVEMNPLIQQTVSHVTPNQPRTPPPKKRKILFCFFPAIFSL